MKVYVESNFVLELALLQRWADSCDEILKLAERGDIELRVPAYALAEPYDTLVRRGRERKRLKQELDRELGQLARTAVYSERVRGFDAVTTLLVVSAAGA